MSRSWLALAMLLTLMGCREDPRRIENENLGFAATFPGPAKLHRHTDPGPFGDVEWFDLAMSPAGRLDETFSVAVGNLPPGDKGFRYKVKSPNGGVVEGIVVVRRGRLHHAQAIVRKEGDPRTEAFLGDLEIRTR